MLLLLPILSPPVGSANTITVNSLNDPSDSGCTLHDAIVASQTGSVTNGCPAGSGNDAIAFSLSGTISLTETLPAISKTLDIDGTGQTVMIDGNSSHQILSVSSGGNLKLEQLTLSHGSAGKGGAIDNQGETLGISNCTFSNNSATELGGAIEHLGNSLTIAASTFSGNRAGNSGGAIENQGSSVTITASTFSANNASTGGAIDNETGTAAVVNSTFSGNKATEGGAISNFNEITIINCTVAGNTGSPSDGGGIFNFNPDLTPAGVKLKGTILADNGSGGDCSELPFLIDDGYNIADDKSCGFTNGTSRSGLDPQLDPAGLSDNGGPTETIALVAGSPAIDQIPSSACVDQNSAKLTTDQRGEPRPDPEDGPNGPCDIGAYEYQETGLDCSKARASAPNLVARKLTFSPERIRGVTGGYRKKKPDITITEITQSEPVIGGVVHGGAFVCRDGYGAGTDTAWIRAAKRDQDGLIYTIGFKAIDRRVGTTCVGHVQVCVQDSAHRGHCNDTGQVYDSTVCPR